MDETTTSTPAERDLSFFRGGLFLRRFLRVLYPLCPWFAIPPTKKPTTVSKEKHTVNFEQQREITEKHEREIRVNTCRAYNRAEVITK